MNTEERLTLKVNGKLKLGFISVEKSKSKFPRSTSRFKENKSNRLEVLDQLVTLDPGTFFSSHRTNYISNRSNLTSIKYLLIRKEFKGKALELLNFYFNITRQETRVQEVCSKRLGNVVVTIYRVSKCNLCKLPKDLTLSIEDLKIFVSSMFEEKVEKVRKVKRIIKNNNGEVI